MSRILVVDDDVAVRGAIKMVLEQDGHDVTLASNGRAGVSAAEADAFDLVICDIFMPGMDGIETIHAFHKTNPRMPVIAMSGFMFRDGQSPAPDYLTLSTKLGAAKSLRKPFRPQELIRPCANARQMGRIATSRKSAEQRLAIPPKEDARHLAAARP